MNDDMLDDASLCPLGGIEPLLTLLKKPADGESLYKVMTIENFLRSVGSSYLHFNRVDSYKDFPGADHHDGAQLPRDEIENKKIKLADNPAYSACDYYHSTRSRTYACCFSLDNSRYIWDNYANGSEKGKLCVVFDFTKLRSRLNKTMEASRPFCGGFVCHQFLNLDYGIVSYVERNKQRANTERLPNPAIYTFLKDERFRDEREFRIALWAFGMGEFALDDGTRIGFPPSLAVPFAFGPAMADGTIQQIICPPGNDYGFLVEELGRLKINCRTP